MKRKLHAMPVVATGDVAIFIIDSAKNYVYQRPLSIVPPVAINT